MEFQSWRKIIVIVVMIAFVWTGIAWATVEQGSPQFQEKESAPVVKKHKSALPWIVLGAAVVGGAVYLLTQKKSTPPVPPDPNKPIDINFLVYNHTQGKIGVYKVSTTTGTKLEVKISTLLDYLRNNGGNRTKANVDGSRIAVRMPAQNGRIGAFVAYADTGAVSFTVAQEMTSLDAFLMNASNKAPYDCVDNDTYNGAGAQMYLNKRAYVVKREDKDGYTGPEEVWSGRISGQDGAFVQMKKAMNPFGMVYSTLTVDQKAASPDYTYGFGRCTFDGVDHTGMHGGGRIEVNPVALNQSVLGMISVGLSEDFEIRSETDDLCGKSTSWTITDMKANLTSSGQDLFAYVLVKDKANW